MDRMNPRFQMKYRYRVLSCALVGIVAMMPMAVAAQTAGQAAGSAYDPPRTPWGDPDLQGLWRGLHEVPFVRPPEYKDRQFRTDAEIAELERKAEASNELRRLGKQENRGFRNQPNYNSIVGYSPEKARFSRRTSAIVDPADGQLPPWTVEQVNRYEWRESVSLGRGDADWTVDRPASERCIPIMRTPALTNWGMATSGRPAGPQATAGTVQGGAAFFVNTSSGGGPRRIIQGPGYVAIVIEEGVETYHIIPLNRSPHVGPKFKHWLGDARGHWEGTTLVVETTNIKYNYPIVLTYQDGGTGLYPGEGNTLRFVERFTMVGPDTIEYRYTVEDPSVYTRPYTVVHELTRNDGYKISSPICHEGHDDMPAALGSARLDEETHIQNQLDMVQEREPRLKELKEEAIRAAEAAKQPNR